MAAEVTPRAAVANAVVLSAAPVLPHPWSAMLGDLRLGQGTPYRWSAREGFLDLPSLRSADVPRPDAHGVYGQRDWADGRYLTIGFQVRRGIGGVDFDAAVHAARRTLVPSEDTVPLWVNIPGRGPVRWDVKVRRARVVTDSAFNAGLARIDVQLYAPDPVGYGDEQAASTGFPLMVGGLEFDLFTDGSGDLRTNLARRPRGGAFQAAGSAWGTGGAGHVSTPVKGAESNGMCYAYGDSWSAAATYAQVWPERVQVMAGFTGLTNRAVSGDRVQMAVARIMNGASAWVPGTLGAVSVGALLNNLGSGDTPENRRTALESSRAAAAFLSASAKYEQDDTRFTYTGSWSTLTADYCSGGTAAYRAPAITAPGELAAQYVDVAVPAGVNYVVLLGTPITETNRGAVWVMFDQATNTELGRVDSHAAAVPTPSGPGGVQRSPIVWRVPGTTARTIRLRLTGPDGFTGTVIGLIDGLLTLASSPPAIAMMKPVEVLHAPYQLPALLSYLRTVPDTVAGEFTNVASVDPAQGWDPASMLGADLLHPNEAGQEHVAAAAATALLPRLPYTNLASITQVTRMQWTTAPSAVPSATLVYSVAQNRPVVVPSQSYGASFEVWSTIPQPMFALIQWLTATGASAGTTAGAVQTVGPEGVTLEVDNAVAPAGAATMRVDLRLGTGATIWSAGDWVETRNLLEERAPIGAYFDGASPSGAWSGTVNASPSTILGPGADTGFLEFGDADGSTGRVVLTNTGTADSWARLRVDGPVEGGFEVLDVGSGRRLRFEGDIAAGSSVSIDTATGTVLLDDVADRSGLLTVREWTPVPPGGSTELMFLPLASHTAATMTITWAPAWW